jgi:uncharacterized membrane protein YgdD (TMEM256/DUF423 family)
MSPRFWIFAAALLGLTAVLAGAAGAHSTLRGTLTISVAARIFDTAQLYHALHALALLGVAAVMAATEGKRARWSGALLQLAALGFTLGVVMFSGGIYVQLARELASSGGIVPAGGFAFIFGWLFLGLSAFGMRAR